MDFKIDLINRAWALAVRHHDGQKYGSHEADREVEYLAHIGQVTFEIMAALQGDPEADANLALCCAILHDTLEDTALTEAEILASFGPEILAGVRALTKDETLPGKPAQMRDSLDRILGCRREVAMVKLADRIVNLSPPPHYWTPEKIAAYREEARLIHATLGKANTYLAGRLAARIEQYPHTEQ
ncbi:HD domain-containing protein [Lewinella sp. W8]|uniref:HD domain-containing protein n=1 Tax=Lewinella sp. W8 TaxID=2528208 RepID=UPI00106747F3|nr:HD domain-containing protein [Lewinella sp. W8]MTB51323.1 HD domain-containing protein [Lewinella sp. W8]